MSRKNWEINGLSLEFDNQDADNMERYENAFDLMEEEAKQLPKDGRVSERIRAYCNVFRNLFDRIFGEGTSEKLFDGVPMSSERYEEIYTVSGVRQRAERRLSSETCCTYFCISAQS